MLSLLLKVYYHTGFSQRIRTNTDAFFTFDNVLTMFCMRVKFNSRARMLNTRLHERKYWIRCCYASNCVLNASSYSERCGYDVFMNINERLSPVYPITLRHVTSLFVTLSPQTRPDAAFTLTWLWCYQDMDDAVLGRKKKFRNKWRLVSYQSNQVIPFILTVWCWWLDSPLFDLINVNSYWISPRKSSILLQRLRSCEDWQWHCLCSDILLNNKMNLWWRSIVPGHRSSLPDVVTWRIRCNVIHNETRFS